MTTVHVMQGLPGSGKSTVARSLASDGAICFSLDDFRNMTGVSKANWSQEREAVVVSAMIESARQAINAGFDIVLDNTHLVPRLPRLYRKEFAPLGVVFEVHSFMHVPIEECITRDAVRGPGNDYNASVGEEVIRRLWSRYEGARKNGWRLTDAWMNSATYVQPKPYAARPSAQSVVLCDIDGTVAINDGHRGHYEYEKVCDDKPNQRVIDLVKVLSMHMPIIFMSGREDRCRLDTLVWLDRFGLVPYDLFMRDTGDHRPDYLVKMELFDAYVRDTYDVSLVLDDRDQVVKMWREMGLTCLQVNYGDF